MSSDVYEKLKIVIKISKKIKIILLKSYKLKELREKTHKVLGKYYGRILCQMFSRGLKGKSFKTN